MEKVSEYIYLDDNCKILASVKIAEGAIDRINNWDVAMAFKHSFLPKSIVYLKVFNQ